MGIRARQQLGLNTMENERTRRQIIAGIMVLLLGLGFWLGHITAGHKATPSAAATNTNTHGPGTASGPGAAASSSGDIAVGFPHTKSGAMSAAANYAATLTSPLLLTDHGRSEIATTIAAAGTQSTLATQLAAELNVPEVQQVVQDAASTTPYALQTVPIAVRAVTATDSQADIQVFDTTIIASSHSTPRSGYTLMDVRLSWSGGDWKLASYTTTPQVGPVPTGWQSPLNGWQAVTGQSLPDVSNALRNLLYQSVAPRYAIP